MTDELEFGGDPNDFGIKADYPSPYECPKCNVESCGIVHDLCVIHEVELGGADWIARKALDTELDARMSEIAGSNFAYKKNIPPSPTLPSFSVARK